MHPSKVPDRNLTRAFNNAIRSVGAFSVLTFGVGLVEIVHGSEALVLDGFVRFEADPQVSRRGKDERGVRLAAIPT